MATLEPEHLFVKQDPDGWYPVFQVAARGWGRQPGLTAAGLLGGRVGVGGRAHPGHLGPRPPRHVTADRVCPHCGVLSRPVLQKAPLLLHYRPKMDLL